MPTFPDHALGALLIFEKVTKPGRYQVTLSDEAWIDIVQAGAYRPSGEFSGVHGCVARDQEKWPPVFRPITRQI